MSGLKAYLRGIGKVVLGIVLSALGYVAAMDMTRSFIFATQDEEDEYLNLGYQDGAGFVRMLNDGEGE